MFVKETLIKNVYPWDLLSEKIAERYKFLIQNKNFNKISEDITKTEEFKKIYHFTLHKHLTRTILQN